ncbi:ParB/RepB/Spo0J family partition protein [Aureibacter tunicatorum]|uniref:ParB-like N-terminal domain-containing protein n=1 Tax=Aureibacter tunicatorum TaxID=866807 RepID=A0AAE3XTF1_9BACT|nr:ParB/Srx family N-terminal domain-containing protein [Aureibacter tunicatorum]MDR6241763.1 hypothetical protein [Aureibacter tunicatorum]BDD07376.1 hypothetical protein AUTU_48590 [Aureibacter tunicatorum]
MAKKSFSVINTRRSSGGMSVINEMKQNINILPELRDLIPPLLPDEFDQLKSNISKEGVREPILIWEYEENKYTIVDGHNRYRCVQEIGSEKVSWSVKRLEFENLNLVKDWMINNQLGRRNLSPSQASYLRGLLYDTKKLAQGAQEGSANASKNKDAESAPLKKGKTVDHIAQRTGVSSRTIFEDHKFQKALDKVGVTNPELKSNILSGRIKVRKKDLIDFEKSNEDEFENFIKSSDKTKSVKSFNHSENKLTAFKVLLTELDNESKPSEKQLNKLSTSFDELIKYLKNK